MTGTLQPTYFSQYHAQSFKALLLQKSWQLITNLYSKNGCLCVVMNSSGLVVSYPGNKPEPTQPDS